MGIANGECIQLLLGACNKKYAIFHCTKSGGFCPTIQVGGPRMCVPCTLLLQVPP